MNFIPVLNAFLNLLFLGISFSQTPDPCEEAREGAAAATLFAKDSVFQVALANIKNAYTANMREHCISFGKDAAGNIISSPILEGGATSGKVPSITKAFADLHNHPNNLPPDAGDLYGLIDINKNNPGYKTRFVLTLNGTVYALLVTDTAKALAFDVKYPRQPPAFVGGPPGLPVAITDEAREMKYQNHCADELVMSYLLEKYNAGVSLLKQDDNGIFYKVITIVSNNGNGRVFSAGSCPDH